MLEAEEEELQPEIVGAPDEVLPPARQTWIEIGVVLSFAVVPPLLGAFLYSHRPPLPFGEHLVALGIQSVAVSVPVAYLMARSGLSWKHYGLGKNLDLSGVSIFVAAFVAGFLLKPYLTRLATLGLHAVSVPARSGFRLGVPDNALSWAGLVFVMLLNGMSEEIAMRGFLTARLYDVLRRPVVASLITGSLFGLYHVYQGWAPAISSAALGFLLGLMFLSTRRLKALMLAHAAIDIAIYVVYATTPHR